MSRAASAAVVLLVGLTVAGLRQQKSARVQLVALLRGPYAQSLTSTTPSRTRS